MSETQTAMYYNGNWYGRSGNTDALDARITQTANNIAPRQISDTASKLIAVGEYFTDKLGRLCVCDVQIASGGSIVVGSNCHVVSEGGLNELNSNKLTKIDSYITYTGSTTEQLIGSIELVVNDLLFFMDTIGNSTPTRIRILNHQYNYDIVDVNTPYGWAYNISRDGQYDVYVTSNTTTSGLNSVKYSIIRS